MRRPACRRSDLSGVLLGRSTAGGVAADLRHAKVVVARAAAVAAAACGAANQGRGSGKAAVWLCTRRYEAQLRCAAARGLRDRRAGGEASPPRTRPATTPRQRGGGYAWQGDKQ